MLIKRLEPVARLLVLLILVVLPVMILVYQQWLRPRLSSVRIIDITATTPENGGFQPGAIRVAVGEPVILRFSSTDVTHGVAIGPGLGIDLGHVDPGHVVERPITFDKPGTYTYYCNSWCSKDHWRMRGVIEVRDTTNSLPVPQRDPIIEALVTEGVDFDASVHEGATDHADSGHEVYSMGKLSAQHGKALVDSVFVPQELRDATWRRSHTPTEAIELLVKANPQHHDETQVLADVVAYFWLEDAQTEQLSNAASLYAKNCAACHGPSGGGDGPAAAWTVKKPVSFSDATHMLGMRSDVMYAKIRRGGMGTDMPNFGTLFTPEETWTLVNYLWTLAITK